MVKIYINYVSAFFLFCIFSEGNVEEKEERVRAPEKGYEEASHGIFRHMAGAGLTQDDTSSCKGGEGDSGLH